MRHKPYIFFFIKNYQFDLPYMVKQWDDTDTHVEEPIAILGGRSITLDKVLLPTAKKRCADFGWTSPTPGVKSAWCHRPRSGFEPMPTYQYRCDKCGKKFERTETISEHEAMKTKCPRCGSTKVSFVPGNRRLTALLPEVHYLQPADLLGNYMAQEKLRSIAIDTAESPLPQRAFELLWLAFESADGLLVGRDAGGAAELLRAPRSCNR